MNETISFVAELDQRQDDVIRALDALNQRIEDVIKTWTDLRLDSTGNSTGEPSA